MFMQEPGRPHLHDVRRVLKYVKATMDFGISFKREKSLKLMGFCDANYDGDPNTRRSTTSYMFMLGQGVIY